MGFGNYKIPKTVGKKKKKKTFKKEIAKGLCQLARCFWNGVF